MKKFAHVTFLLLLLFLLFSLLFQSCRKKETVAPNYWPLIIMKRGWNCESIQKDTFHSYHNIWQDSLREINVAGTDTILSGIGAGGYRAYLHSSISTDNNIISYYTSDISPHPVLGGQCTLTYNKTSNHIEIVFDYSFGNNIEHFIYSSR